MTPYDCIQAKGMEQRVPLLGRRNPKDRIENPVTNNKHAAALSKQPLPIPNRFVCIREDIMSKFDLVGYAASGLVFATFYMRSMVLLRIVGLCANAAFLTYGIGLDLVPVAILHIGLVPVNCWRLCEILRHRTHDNAVVTDSEYGYVRRLLPR
jgi:hypothetical protein